eukprot:CAMPEP_0180474438 /NCGR_PEP_ID=MMETSP1036_2-20121128/30676_1 /TAXON_ID=632150 /ORGANISM="Azadinium spinosum, Strain 3D9" /LENGTH=200 /DNA_ID=CAMNT_0022481753 /DNA_START=325 /DNA_END=923 /DNA_ORIENTATION=+
MFAPFRTAVPLSAAVIPLATGMGGGEGACTANRRLATTGNANATQPLRSCCALATADPVFASGEPLLDPLTPVLRPRSPSLNAVAPLHCTVSAVGPGGGAHGPLGGKLRRAACVGQPHARPTGRCAPHDHCAALARCARPYQYPVVEHATAAEELRTRHWPDQHVATGSCPCRPAWVRPARTAGQVDRLVCANTTGLDPR